MLNKPTLYYCITSLCLEYQYPLEKMCFVSQKIPDRTNRLRGGVGVEHTKCNLFLKSENRKNNQGSVRFFKCWLVLIWYINITENNIHFNVSLSLFYPQIMITVCQDLPCSLINQERVASEGLTLNPCFAHF